jgi:hypothetical protein
MLVSGLSYCGHIVRRGRTIHRRRAPLPTIHGTCSRGGGLHGPRLITAGPDDRAMRNGCLLNNRASDCSTDALATPSLPVTMQHCNRNANSRAGDCLVTDPPHSSPLNSRGRISCRRRGIRPSIKRRATVRTVLETPSTLAQRSLATGLQQITSWFGSNAPIRRRPRRTSFHRSDRPRNRATPACGRPCGCRSGNRSSSGLLFTALQRIQRGFCPIGLPISTRQPASSGGSANTSRPTEVRPIAVASTANDVAVRIVAIVMRLRRDDILL